MTDPHSDMFFLVVSPHNSYFVSPAPTLLNLLHGQSSLKFSSCHYMIYYIQIAQCVFTRSLLNAWVTYSTSIGSTGSSVYLGQSGTLWESCAINDQRERGASKQRNQPVRSIGATQTSPVQMCGGSPLFHWPLSIARVISLLLFGPRASKDKFLSFQFLKWRNFS